MSSGKIKRPELLVPASSLEVLKTAVIFGADAVYIGGEAYGLRAKAKNFSMEEMARMPQLCVQAEFEIKSGRIQAEGGLEKVMLEILAMGGRNGKMDRAAAGARR